MVLPGPDDTTCKYSGLINSLVLTHIGMGLYYDLNYLSLTAPPIPAFTKKADSGCFQFVAVACSIIIIHYWLIKYASSHFSKSMGVLGFKPGTHLKHQWAKTNNHHQATRKYKSISITCPVTEHFRNLHLQAEAFQQAYIRLISKINNLLTLL